MFAVLGDVQFDLITYFDGFEASFGVEFAEHPLLKGKPRLQSVGQKLDEIRLEFAFHHVFCDPEAELAKLRKALVAQQALSLVFASGAYKGRFVITEVEAISRRTDARGTVLAMEARMGLKEFVPPPGPAKASSGWQIIPGKTVPAPAVSPSPPNPAAQTAPAPAGPTASEWRIIPGRTQAQNAPLITRRG